MSRDGEGWQAGGRAGEGRGVRTAVSWIAVSLAILALLPAAGCSRGEAPEYRPAELWFYESTNLADEKKVEALERIWRRAAAAGYRHVMLADTKFARLEQMDDAYFDHVRRVRTLGAELGLEIVPAVFQVGRSNSMLALDPNLAEGLPVKGALFEVHDGLARLVPDPPVGFDDPPEVRDFGLTMKDGVATVRNNLRRVRFAYRVRVHPHRCYRVSARIRTEGFTGRPLIQVLAGDRVIHYVRSLGVEPDQDWREHQIVFNSLDSREVLIYFGAWKRARGTLQWRDWKIEEVGPVNVLARSGCAFEVDDPGLASAVEPVTDPRLGVVPWPGQFEAWHDPPPVRTRLPDGTRFRASWHHAAIVNDQQVTVCPADTAVMRRLRDEAERMRALWDARGYLMMHDEIRCMGRDSSCLRTGLSPGRVLADHVARCVSFLDGAEVYAWSDMFDPEQNAVDDYYLVGGDLAGSWKGLPQRVVIVNWDADNAASSLSFFAARGHRQLIAGYYDGDPGAVRSWLRAAAGVQGVFGVMYTTWRDDYGDLEAFARACRGK